MLPVWATVIPFFSRSFNSEAYVKMVRISLFTPFLSTIFPFPGTRKSVHQRVNNVLGELQTCGAVKRRWMLFDGFTLA